MTAPWSIRKATDADLEAIAAWLKNEHDREVEGCFWCNIEVIRKCHAAGEMTVLAEAVSDDPVAFLTASLDSPEISILEVRVDRRGRGLGRALVEHHIERAIDAGLTGLVIQRRPETSIAFWNRMGFRELPLPACLTDCYGYTSEHAIQLFDIPLPFNPEIYRVLIEARIETVSGNYVYSQRLAGRRAWGSQLPIQLERRFVVFSPNPDLYIQYLVD